MLEHMPQDCAVEFHTETIVASRCLKKVLEDANSPLSKVDDLWWRVEYMGR